MVEPAARPQLPEVLREQVERDEGDDEHGGAGDHDWASPPPSTTPRIRIMIPIDWKVATNSSGMRATRARDSCARYTAASDGHSRARGPSCGRVPGRLLDGRSAARQHLGGYDTHVALLLFAPAVAL